MRRHSDAVKRPAQNQAVFEGYERQLTPEEKLLFRSRLLNALCVDVPHSIWRSALEFAAHCMLPRELVSPDKAQERIKVRREKLCGLRPSNLAEKAGER